MTEHTQSNTDSDWFANALFVLLNTPHTVPPDASPLLPGDRTSHDEFSSRFDEVFAPDAHGFVGRHPVDRERLKDLLLGLHSRWNAAEGACVGCEVHEVPLEDFHPTMAARMEFTPLYRYPREKEMVIAEASGHESEGAKRIECMVLEGDETLFRPELFAGGGIWSVF